MGRDTSGMEDDEPVAEMPTFICSFEDGRSKVSCGRLPAGTSNGESKVERPVRDCSRLTGSTSSLSLDGDSGDTNERSSEKGAEEGKQKNSGEAVEKDAKGNNNNNCNGGGGGRRGKRRARAVDILRRNLGVAKSPYVLSNTNNWTPRDTERDADDGDDNNDEDAASEETGEAGIEIKRTECDSETSDEDGGQSVNLTGEGDEVAPSTKEHVYCTVYCIANEGDGSAVTDDGTDDAESQMVLESPPEVCSSPEPSLYTLEDLVDPFGDIVRHVSLGQADTDAAVQSCWVCLEGKSIAPLPCCKKTVCDECLKIYVTTQVGERRRGLEGGAVEGDHGWWWVSCDS